jgi:hypothetical protein
VHKLVVFVPESHLDAVKDALFAAGAGRYKQYDRCAWQVLGRGQFRPLAGSDPFIGSEDVTESVSEYRVEMLCRDELLSDVLDALVRAHPYEEPAYEAYPVITSAADLPSARRRSTRNPNRSSGE